MEYANVCWANNHQTCQCMVRMGQSAFRKSNPILNKKVYSIRKMLIAGRSTCSILPSIIEVCFQTFPSFRHSSAALCRGSHSTGRGPTLSAIEEASTVSWVLRRSTEGVSVANGFSLRYSEAIGRQPYVITLFFSDNYHSMSPSNMYNVIFVKTVPKVGINLDPRFYDIIPVGCTFIW